MKEETAFKPYSGFLMILVLLAIIAGSLYLLISIELLWMIAVLIIAVYCLIGLFVVNPNQSTVLVLFGTYKGTVKTNGFFWVNPFFSKQKISLRARNLDSAPIKVNDNLGNPIMIGIVLVWRVKNTYSAAFDVDDYEHFVKVQSESALRKLAGKYPYDDIEDANADITLRGGGEEVNHELEKEIQERISIAGIEVIEARINYLAYSEEIASAMLQRQQATAIVAARFKIVEGAVGMVESALELLSSKELVQLDEERKAAMVSNLMVVLCADKAAQPVVNTGTLHQ